MKYLKIITILVISLLVGNNTEAQSITFEYDAAGNMVQRNLTCITNPPGMPLLVNVSSTSATLKWPNDASITGYQTRKQGGAWRNGNNITSPAVLLFELEKCQNYQVRLAYSCAGETLYSPVTSFVTKGCTSCSASGMEMYMIPEATTATINWDIYPDALYIVNYRKFGESSFKKYTTPIPFLILVGLEACTTFEFAMQLTCADGATSARGKIFRFTTKGCRLQQAENVLPLIEVHPNPAQHQIEISLPGEQKPAQLTIYNSTGQLMEKLQANANKTAYAVNVSSYPSGIYLVTAQIAGKIVTQKFTVQ